MLAALMLLLAVTTPSSASAPQEGAGARTDPPIRLSLNADGHYAPGDRARVHVQTADDGYLVVLRTDVDGWIRVLYPVDPSDDDFVRGGHKFEIRGRGDREAFAISRSAGTGTILAARSGESFHFDRFTRGNRWDYRALDSLRAGADAESTLLDIVQQMAGDVHFDYDLVQYTVSDPTYHRAQVGLYGSYGWPGFGWQVGFGYGPPYFYDPFFYGFYGAAFYSPFFFFRPSCFGCFRSFVFVNFGRPVRFSRPFFPPFGPFHRPRFRSGIFGTATLGFSSRPGFGSRAFTTAAAARLDVRAPVATILVARPAARGTGLVTRRRPEVQGRLRTFVQPLYSGGRGYGGGPSRSYGGRAYGGGPTRSYGGRAYRGGPTRSYGGQGWGGRGGGGGRRGR